MSSLIMPHMFCSPFLFCYYCCHGRGSRRYCSGIGSVSRHVDPETTEAESVQIWVEQVRSAFISFKFASGVCRNISNNLFVPLFFFTATLTSRSLHKSTKTALTASYSTHDKLDTSKNILFCHIYVICKKWYIIALWYCFVPPSGSLSWTHCSTDYEHRRVALILMWTLQTAVGWLLCDWIFSQYSYLCCIYFFYSWI